MIKTSTPKKSLAVESLNVQGSIFSLFKKIMTLEVVYTFTNLFLM